MIKGIVIQTNQMRYSEFLSFHLTFIKTCYYPFGLKKKVCMMLLC